MPYGMRLDALPLRACPAAQRVVIAYDVPDARARRRLMRAIVGRAPRIQRSVYEGHLTAADLRALARELGDIATGSEDRVIVAPLCSRCAARRLWIGAGEPPAHGCDGTMYWPTASDATQLIVA